MNKVMVVLVVMLAVIFASNLSMAAQSEHLSTKSKQSTVDRNSDGKIDGVDIYDESGKVVKRGYDDNGDMRVDRWQTYDENTGTPIVTQSDSAYLLQ